MPLHGAQAEPAATGQVRFSEATAEWNLALPAAAAPPDPPRTLSAEDYSADWVAANLLPQLGSGVAIRDLDADGQPEVLFVRDGSVVVFRNTGGGFEAWGDSGLETDGDGQRDGRRRGPRWGSGRLRGGSRLERALPQPVG